MGSLPEGTLCAYCRIRTASYVPDHCIGPTCLSGPGNCYDRAAVVGWQVITDGYRKMRCQKNHLACIVAQFRSFLGKVCYHTDIQRCFAQDHLLVEIMLHICQLCLGPCPDGTTFRHPTAIQPFIKYSFKVCSACWGGPDPDNLEEEQTIMWWVRLRFALLCTVFVLVLQSVRFEKLCWPFWQIWRAFM